MLPLPVAFVTVALTSLPDPQCVLLLKGEGFAFHAIRSQWRAPSRPPEPPAGPGLPGGFRAVSMPRGEWAVTYTDLTSGQMKKVFEGGGWSYQSPVMNLMHSAEHSVGLVGWAADPGHLYLLLRTTDTKNPYIPDRTVTYTLYVYRGKDARVIARFPVEGVKESVRFPGILPESGLHQLPLTKDGLKLGTSEFHYQDGKLVPTVPPKPSP
ncbi:MAG TPA: hypothetical protein VKE74_24375 [Gemmataceae bacterium]|nr:hypothetical protein [Gemmataceae bacterium]